MNKASLLLIVLVAGAVLLGIWYVLEPGSGTVATSTATSTSERTDAGNATSTSASGVSRIRVALLDTAGTSKGQQRGCDKVVLVPFDIATTTAPLTSAMLRLFSFSTTSVAGYFNFIDRTNGTLSFKSASVIGGTATIYLTGSLSGLAGVCDDPRAQIQIEETALQFPSIERVVILLNGATTTLTPSQR